MTASEDYLILEGEYEAYKKTSKAQKKVYKCRLKETRNKASKECRTQHKGWFRTLDIIAIILVVLNFGALFITGVMVSKADPAVTLVETNPVQCAWNGWQCNNHMELAVPILMHMLTWACLLCLYIYIRNNTYNITRLWYLTIIVLIYFAAITFDFNNNLGLYIGKIIFGA